LNWRMHVAMGQAPICEDCRPVHGQDFESVSCESHESHESYESTGALAHEYIRKRQMRDRQGPSQTLERSGTELSSASLQIDTWRPGTCERRGSALVPLALRRAPSLLEPELLTEGRYDETWEVVFKPAVLIRKKPDREAATIGNVAYRQQLRGRVVHDGNWLELASRPGYVMISNANQGTLLNRIDNEHAEVGQLHIGDRVRMKQRLDRTWQEGVVTDLRPLQVARHGLNGSQWDLVRRHKFVASDYRPQRISINANLDDVSVLRKYDSVTDTAISSQMLEARQDHWRQRKMQHRHQVEDRWQRRP